LVVQGLAFPEPVPIFATWHPNNENEANIAIEALLAGDLKVTDVLLGDETFGGGLFPYLYEEAGGWVLSPKQLPQERRSWKDDLDDDRKETLELLFQRIIQALGLKECQVKGEGRNGAFVLASVWLYQICFLANYREGKPLADQRSSGLRSMAHPKWLMVISFNLHRPHLIGRNRQFEVF